MSSGLHEAAAIPAGGFGVEVLFAEARRRRRRRRLAAVVILALVAGGGWAAADSMGDGSHLPRRLLSHSRRAPSAQAQQTPSLVAPAVAFLVSPNHSAREVIRDGSRRIQLRREDDYLPVAKVDGSYILLFAGRRDGNWTRVVIVTANGRQQTIVRAAYIPAAAVHNSDIAYVTEPVEGKGLHTATVWKRNWVSGKVLGHITRRMPVDGHATGGLDDVGILGFGAQGIWVSTASPTATKLWTGNSTDIPTDSRGFVGTSLVGQELEFHRGDCWSYKDAATSKSLWRQCGPNIRAGLGVSPDGHFMVLDHHHHYAIRDLRSGATTNLPTYLWIGYGMAWEGSTDVIVERPVGGGDLRHTYLLRCSPRTGACRHTGPRYRETEVFTASGPGL